MMKKYISLLILWLGLSLPLLDAQELTLTQQLWKNSFDAEKVGNYKQALEFIGAIRNQTDSYYANLREGWLSYLLHQYDAAIESYLRASRLAPGAVSPLLGLSNCYQAKNDNPKAIRICLSVLALDPTNYTANNRLADLYFKQKDYLRAASYYLKLSTLYPEDLELASSLAWCYLNQGDNVKAELIFNNILIVSPNHSGASSGLAELKNKKKVKPSK